MEFNARNKLIGMIAVSVIALAGCRNNDTNSGLDGNNSAATTTPSNTMGNSTAGTSGAGSNAAMGGAGQGATSTSGTDSGAGTGTGTGYQGAESRQSNPGPNSPTR